MTDRKEVALHRRYGGGARREASERVTITRPELPEVEGWTLNVSRGGLRVVVEDLLQVGEMVEVRIGSDEATPTRPARIAWLKEAADGQIVGLQLLDTVGSIPPPDEPPADDLPDAGPIA